MDSRKKWYSGYYILIIIICLLVALFIWFSFNEALKNLDKKKEDSYKKKLNISQRS